MKKKIQAALLRHGYSVRSVAPNELGFDPFRDMRLLVGNGSQPMLFDVGANIGQSVLSFREHFRSPVIHAFEPGHSVFEQLKKRTVGISNLHLNCCAIGAQCGQNTLQENKASVLSSFLAPGKDASKGEIIHQALVDVDTIDNYCARTGIRNIDVLKSDTQGFDFEVLKGALSMIQQHKIHLIFIEMHFCDSYAGVPQFEVVFQYLKTLGFLPVCFYNQTRRNSHVAPLAESNIAPLAEIDGLFIDPQWRAA